MFVLAVGYYITPALVGGPTGQLISNMIAFHMRSSLNWGLAAALGTVLLIGVLVLYWIYNKVIGIDRMRLDKKLWHFLHTLARSDGYGTTAFAFFAVWCSFSDHANFGCGPAFV